MTGHGMAQDSFSVHLIQARGAGDLRESRFVFAVWKASGKIKPIDGLQTEMKIMLHRSSPNQPGVLGIKGYQSSWVRRTDGVVNIPIGPNISA